MHGGIHARGTNITIRGRGILDGNIYPRFKGPTRYPVLLENCRDITVEGIIIKDGWSWTFVPGGCDRVRIENVKLLSARVENGDGFDIVNSRNVTIANSFVRSDDDCLTPKGMGARWQGFYGDSGICQQQSEKWTYPNQIKQIIGLPVWQNPPSAIIHSIQRFGTMNMDWLLKRSWKPGCN